MNNSENVMALMGSSLNENLGISGNYSQQNANLLYDVVTESSPLANTAWNYWWGGYYPQVIRESYPVYLQERSKDQGKHAFEIIKALQDKKLMKLEKVSDFIEAMDCLIKIL